jgi:2-polyprenyl-6-hydroxyphenyl methylase/3-demethylubiquinone-9 3-methyltransferase
VTSQERARELWAGGQYRRISDLIRAQGRRLVEWSGLDPGDRVLDVGAGTGAASLPAAEAGARVTATDITPELLEVGEEAARARGLQLEWRTADAMALPFPDASYDVVLSAIGAMFAPDQQATADELLRVCRPAGTIAMANWTPDGGAASRLSAAMAPFLPPPQPGPAPTDWGVPEHVAHLFGDRVDELVTQHEVIEVDFGGGPDELAELYLSAHPPMVAASAAVEPSRRDDLARAVREGFRAEYADFGGVRYDYLLVRATVR